VGGGDEFEVLMAWVFGMVGDAWKEITTGERTKTSICGEVAGIWGKPRYISRTEGD
jgi:hypothetical protein